MLEFGERFEVMKVVLFAVVMDITIYMMVAVNGLCLILYVDVTIGL